MTYEDAERIEKIAERLIAGLSAAQAVPIEHTLWRAAEIAAYLKRTKRSVQNHVLPAPGFPAPIRLPSPDGRARVGLPLWKAQEVIAWVEKQQRAP